MQLVVHHRIVVDSDGKVADASKLDFNNKYWIASEKISGLSITPDVTDTRPAAVAKAIKLLEKFSDSQLAAILEREIIKQVKHQLGARL
jgi:tyrosyl-tRNA synthetase